MKTIQPIFFAVAAYLILVVESSETIEDIFLNERRFLLYNSKSENGTCLSVCNGSSATLMSSRKPAKGTSGTTQDPTANPTKLPTNSSTTEPTKSPTRSPTPNPTRNPTREPTPNRTRNPTTYPTERPTRSPTKTPTSRPTIEVTKDVASPSTSECVWPAEKYSAITKGDMTSGAHNIYKQIAVGGKLTNPSNSHVTIDGKVYYGKSYEGRFNFNRGKQQITDLADIPLDFAQYEWLARNMKSSDVNGKKVIVKTTGKDGSENGCYNLFDFMGPDGQGYDHGNTLVVFNTDDDVCLTKTHNGRQFGPSVLAPFSKVTLNNAGFIDGAVIAKEFTTVVGSNKGTDQQLHGAMYNGPIKCIEAPSSSSANSKSIVASESKEEECSCEVGDGSDQSWKCGKRIYVCPNVESVCSQGGENPTYYRLTQDQCEVMKSVELGENCITLPQHGINKGKKLRSRVCYNDNGVNEWNAANKGCNFCEDSIVPPFLN